VPASTLSADLPAMISDDVFRSRLETTIASLRYWVPQIADCARIEESQGPGFWKIKVTPATAGACPFELMLRTSQVYHIVIGRETYEDLPVETMDLFLPLVEAIADGRLIERRLVSMATGQVAETTTIVDLGRGKEWRASRRAKAFKDLDLGASLHNDHHFLPYHR